MKPAHAVVGALLAFAAQVQACPGPDGLEKLRQQEMRYWLDKVPPAFRHGVEDQRIALELRRLPQGECRAVLTVKLPAEDLETANKQLDAEPAKRIMLLSQGYRFPESPLSTAEFGIDPVKNVPLHADTLQTASLGKLRASVELLYATLTQAGAALAPNPANAVAWSADSRAREIRQCAARLHSPASPASDAACACRADGLAQALSERQMEYQYYVRANPYASATGVGRAFDALEKQIEQRCGVDRHG